jgi:hypothetical protein
MKRLISLWSEASSLSGAQRTIVAMVLFLLAVNLDDRARIKPQCCTVKS